MKYFKIPIKRATQIDCWLGEGDLCPGDLVEGEISHREARCLDDADGTCHDCRIEFANKYIVEEK